MKIVWDLGGVLLRWQPLQLLREVLPARAVDDDSAAHWRDAVFQSFGGDWHEFDRGSVEPDELARRIARRSGLAQAEAAAVIAAVPPHLQPLQEAVALLDALAAGGFEQHYLSNMPRPYADHIERELGDICQQILQIHDSILVECEPENLEKVEKSLKYLMENIYPALGVKLKVDVKHGATWAAL